MSPNRNTIYYLPGYGGRVHTGLGQALLSRGVDLAGRETVGDFRGMRFMDQIETVAEDLQTHFGARTPTSWPTPSAPTCSSTPRA